jgi:cyclophilin family peptidyl-prolyl cis-trans isomerase
VAQVKRAHATEYQPSVRKVPLAKRRRPEPKGVFGFVRSYPWASTIFTVLIVGMLVLVLHSAQLGPFAPPAKAKPFALTCQQPKTRSWSSTPKMTIDQNKQYTGIIHTPRGDITIALDAKNAPNAVNNFVFLAQNDYFCGTYFWRVEKPGQPSPLDNQPSQLSLIQGGSVTTNGQDPTSDPGYTIQDDPVVGNYTPGTVAMANTGKPNSGSAQFFIDIGDESQYFSKTYSIFGKVTSGMDVVAKIQPKDLMNGVTIQVK